MAARVLLQRRSVAALAALGGMALAPATVLAEAPAAAANRKPIYDDLDAPSPNSQTSPAPSPAAPSAPRKTLLPSSWSEPAASSPSQEEPRGPTPTDRLAVQVGRARMFLYGHAVAVEDRVNTAVDSALDLEQSFTNTLASLAPPRDSGEKLMPGVIYVLVAAMAGSIVARNRNLVVRAALPLALGVAAGWAVVPLTMRNVSDLAWRYEQRFPAVADAHLGLRDSVQRGVSFAKVHTRLGVRYVDDKVTDAREAVEGWVKQGK